MNGIAAPTTTSTHRRPDSVVVNSTWDREAFEILRTYCPPGRRATGKFLSRLLFEHDARIQERARLRETLSAALNGTSTGARQE